MISRAPLLSAVIIVVLARRTSMTMTVFSRNASSSV
jgi:hypothetical protein